MATRTVQIGLVTYTDTDGARRIGQQGEQVDVDPADLSRFDRANGTAPEAKPAPKKKAATPKKAAQRKRT